MNARFAELEKLDPAAWLGSVVCLGGQRSDASDGTWLQKLFGRGLETPELKDRFAAQCAEKRGALLGRRLAPVEGRNVAMALGLTFGHDSPAAKIGEIAEAILAGTGLLLAAGATILLGAEGIIKAFSG